MLRRCLFVTFFLASVAFAQQKDNPEQLPKLQHLSADQVDRSVDPCTDFYQYTCSKFLRANPIPADQAAWGTFGPLTKWNQMVLRQSIEASAAKKQGRTPVEQKVGDFWTSCMDEKSVDANSLRELTPEIKQIASIKDKSQLVDEIAHLHASIGTAWSLQDNATFAPLFGFTAQQDYQDATRMLPQFDQGGLALPGRDFYLADDERSLDIRKKYVAHVAKLLKLTGESEAQAASDAATVLKIETDLARAAMDVIKRRDPKNTSNKMTLGQFRQLAPSFNWQRYLTLMHAPSADNYLVTAPEFFRGLEQALQTYSLEQWKAYLRWQLVHETAPFLSKAFVEENFSFYAKTLQGAPELQPRWKRCVNATDTFLGEAAGQGYAQRAFSAQSKQRVLEMVKAEEAALDEDIGRLDWMQPQTQEQARKKLHLLLEKVGYPDNWRDYSALVITPQNYLENVHRATAFESARWIQKIGKPVDRYEWTMTPPTVDAYYDPQMNTINFPAGILQIPFFSNDQDDATNFGAEGAVIGHEITHGFDDQGRKFDGQGDLRDWWTEQDAKEYDQRGKCISDEYTQEIPEAGLKQNGLLTQGEDTADNGGLYIAMYALQNELKKQGKTLETKGDDGLTELQHFYLSFANNWCSEFRPELMRTWVLTNPHSIPKYRVNNTVANMPEFAQAFGCKKGQPMAPENACRVW